MTTDDRIASHYSGGALLSAIAVGLDALGKTFDTATIADLAPVDEFHIGGRPATTELCEQLHMQPGSTVLDVGCGIGGTARFIASTFGCDVTGIDLTPEYIDVATELTTKVGLDNQVRFEVGSALAMPFDDGSFDVATQLHVGMNIDDKNSLFAEVSRVLKPGGRFGVYDIMRTSDEAHEFPVPWAADESMSFVADPATNRAALEAGGFLVTAQRDRGEAAGFFAAQRQKAAEVGGPPPLGVHVIIGGDAPVKIANLVEAIGAGTLAPFEIICEKR